MTKYGRFYIKYKKHRESHIANKKILPIVVELKKIGYYINEERGLRIFHVPRHVNLG